MKDINLSELEKIAIEENKDLYKLVATKLYEVDYNSVTTEQRSLAKKFIFTYIYGRTEN